MFLSEFQLYYTVDRCSNQDVQNKNLAYIENHETAYSVLGCTRRWTEV